MELEEQNLICPNRKLIHASFWKGYDPTILNDSRDFFVMLNCYKCKG